MLPESFRIPTRSRGPCRLNFIKRWHIWNFDMGRGIAPRKHRYVKWQNNTSTHARTMTDNELTGYDGTHFVQTTTKNLRNRQPTFAIRSSFPSNVFIHTILDRNNKDQGYAGTHWLCGRLYLQLPYDPPLIVPLDIKTIRHVIIRIEVATQQRLKTINFCITCVPLRRKSAHYLLEKGNLTFT